MGLAYVIMPYDKAFDRVYRNLIKPAVEACELECKRTDKAGKGGQVMANVIHDLAEAQIVIADISAVKHSEHSDVLLHNWNVAYELGIRHALSKKGTIILCNEESNLPYDISGYDIILYPSDWLDRDLDDEIIRKIVTCIKTNLTPDVSSDSPVHDIFSSLPGNLIQFFNTSDDAEQRQIQELNAQIASLKKDNAVLQEMIDNAGLNADTSKQKAKSTEEQILEAIENSKYISDTAVDTLRDLFQDGKKEEFARFLAKVLDYGYLDEGDCRRVFGMCSKLDNPTIVRIFLERAVEFYPDNEELQGFLADTYSDDYRTRDRALSMANKMIGLNKKNGKIELQNKVRSSRMIGSFFNVYISLKLYKEIIDVGYQLLDVSPNNKALILRNIILAYQSLEQFDDAIRVAKQLIAEDPSDDQNHYCLFGLFYSMHNYKAAYCELEKSIACDSEYTEYYHKLAALICDEKIARNTSGEYVQIMKSEKESYAVPFLIRALLIDDTFLDKALVFMRNNRFNDSFTRLFNTIQNHNDIEEAFSNLDYSAVNACADVDCTKWELE